MDIARESIKRKTVTLFICGVVAVAGISSYFKLGKLEDPAFTIKTAVVTTQYDGANAAEVDREVTSRVEEAIQAMGEIKHLRSRSSAGLSMVYVDIKDQYTARDLPQLWDVLRQKITDLQPSLPPGASTSIVNNDYGDVYGQFYALVGDGYTMRELWDYADYLEKVLVMVPGVKKVEIIGDQSEAVYVEISMTKLATLGLEPNAIFSVLNQQNTLSTVGNTEVGDFFIRVAPTGTILTVEDIGDLVIGGSGGNLIRLKDVATVRQDYLEPKSFVMRHGGKQVLGIGISTVQGGNVVTMGNAVKAKLQELQAQTPVGMELEEIFMQSDVVTEAVNNFLMNLIESLIIVVGVLLVFMGIRTGLLIGGVLLLTIAATLWIMELSGVFLQSVSLAALIIALGSLVDNAIVVSEGMLVGVERGNDVVESASQTVESNKWALLGGTTIAVLAFGPIGLSQDSTGEFCRSLLQVVGISMMLSWVAAITVAPVLGTVMLKPSVQTTDPYDRFLFRCYRSFLEYCLRQRYGTVAVVVMAFLFSLWAFGRVDKTFFPEDDNVYYTLDLWEPQGTSIDAHLRASVQVEQYLLSKPEVANVTAFVGNGGLRFTLTYTPEDLNSAYSQLLVRVKDPATVNQSIEDVERYIAEKLPSVLANGKLFSKGSTSKAKIEARFYGTDLVELRKLAAQAMAIMETHPSHQCVRSDWRQLTPVLQPQVMRDQMRTLGLGRSDINSAFLMATTGYTVGVYRDDDRLWPILALVPEEERYQVNRFLSFPIWAPAANQMVPLGTLVSSVDTVYEDAIVRRRDRIWTITAQSDVKHGHNVNNMREAIRERIESIPLPSGYRLEWGGEYESSMEAQRGLWRLLPACVAAMFGICVFLFNGYKQPIIIFLCVPMILIGVSLGLWLMKASFSFMALLGLLSLIGMLVKNTVVLLDQVAADFAAGKDHYRTIVDSGVSRLRPVSMSAITTVFGVVPLIWDVLFSSMAICIAFGLTVSTILTLVVVPVLTAIFYNVPSPKKTA